MSKNDVSLPDIKFKNNLKKHHLTFSLIEQIAEKIKQIPSYELLRVEIKLVRTTCNIVEKYVKTGNSKNNSINKKKLVVDSLCAVFSHSTQEILLIESLIDYLFNNDQIKKSSWWRLAKNLWLDYSKLK